MMHHLSRFASGCAVVLTVLAGPSPATPQTPKDPEELRREISALAWQRGPTEGRIGSVATLEVAEGQAFLDGPTPAAFSSSTRTRRATTTTRWSAAAGSRSSTSRKAAT
jgi:hypothetical protein